MWRGRVAPWTDTVHSGHAIDVLNEMPPNTVHACLFSPPYWGVRDYTTPVEGDSGEGTNTDGDEDDTGYTETDTHRNEDPMTAAWGGDISCDHRWSPHDPDNERGNDVEKDHPEWEASPVAEQGEVCVRCDAWYGQMGHEPTLNRYLTNLKALCRAVRRVLRHDGSLWLNLGDIYGSTGGRQAAETIGTHDAVPRNQPNRGGDLSHKAKALLPQRAAGTLREDGWCSLGRIVWNKPNPKPESVVDRLTDAHEWLLWFTPTPDTNAAQDEDDSVSGLSVPDTYVAPGAVDPRQGRGNGFSSRLTENILTAATAAGEDHIAAYPPKLCEPPLELTAPPSVCAACGAPPTGGVDDRHNTESGCDCDAETAPGVVLDPMTGNGNTLVAAGRTGRQYVGIEANPTYAKQAEEAAPSGVQQRLGDI